MWRPPRWTGTTRAQHASASAWKTISIPPRRWLSCSIWPTRLKSLAGVVGLLQRRPDAFLQAAPASDDWTPERIQVEIDARVAAKKAKNFAEADRIRKVLLDAGIVLEDTPKGTTWRRA